MAPLEDITNVRKKFSTHIELEPEYRSIKSYIGSTGKKFISEDLKLELRRENKKCIDLWVDGMLYPTDPATGNHIPCTNLHTFLRYVGDGYDGLLGYCKRLEAKNFSQISSLQGKLMQAEHVITTGGQVIKEMHAIIEKHTEELTNLRETHTTERRAKDSIIEMLNKELHEKRVENNELLKKTNELVFKEGKLEDALVKSNNKTLALMKNAIAYKERKRTFKNVEILCKSGGAFKKRIRATR